MTETVLNELLKLKEGLQIRVSLVSPGTAPYFEKDLERLQRLIDQLQQEQR